MGLRVLEKTINEKIDCMDVSSHMVLFSALSLSPSYFSDILEIGTYKGETSNLLSRLFPSGNITTIDLPASDPIFFNSYLGARGNANRQKIYTEILSQNLTPDNIHFIETNSFFLLSVLDGKKFDLIWLDGGHLYPEIAWDACQAYWLCKPGGLIIFDDVALNSNTRTTDKLSGAVHEVVTYISNRTNCKVSYLLKRLDPKYNSVPSLQKHIAVLEKCMAPDIGKE
tara:strand:- start:552 stop:1229 length:678 start_codon:yes stop_codon:yes gene_type:complete